VAAERLPGGAPASSGTWAPAGGARSGESEAPPCGGVRPYLLLQFFFGGLFPPVIFYFKSSSICPHVLALGLGGLLVANEFLEDRYRRFTLTWACSACARCCC